MSLKCSRIAPIVLASLVLVFTSGCSTLIGNVKPVDEKSESYGIADLSKQNDDWNALKPENNRPSDVTASEVSDVAFQSKKTGSTISLTSGCRASNASSEHSLKQFADTLLFGITDITQRIETPGTLQNVPSLEVTVRGQAEGDDIMLRAIVLRKKTCVYDLTYIATPQHFVQDEPKFAQFVQSLRLKD